jgi:hypothetical protein
MAYDILFRKRTKANWARRSSLPSLSPDPFATLQGQQEIRSVVLLKQAAERGDPTAKQLWARKLGFLRNMKARAAGGYPDSAHCQRAMTVLAQNGVVVSGSGQDCALSCGTNRSPVTVKGQFKNGHRVPLMGQDDPLATLPAKERALVAKLIVLRKQADTGNRTAQRVVETVAQLQIFTPPQYAEPAKL